MKFLIIATFITFTGASACSAADYGMVGVTDTVVSADIGGFALSKECGLKFNTGNGWIHEIKDDGFRTLICIDGKDVRAFTRSGYNESATAQGFSQSSTTVKP